MGSSPVTPTIKAPLSFGKGVLLLKGIAMLHLMKLDPSPFQKIKKGEKTIELRLFDTKRQKIYVGDMVRFECNSTEALTAKVKALHVFQNFEQLYAALPLTQCGYTEADAAHASPEDMLAYYSGDQIETYGVVGIELTEIQPC